MSGPANLARIDAADRTADPGTAGERIDAALERVGLLAAKKKHYRAYSLGMKQRLAIAASLLQPRELIILDEPTNGLDPQGTREVRGLIREIATGGITVLVSSHLLAEVEQICSHVGVMRTGRLVFQGTLDELRARGAARVEVRTTEVERAAEILGKLGLADVAGPPKARSARSWPTRRPNGSAANSSTRAFPVAGLNTPGPTWRTCSSGSRGRDSMSTAELTRHPGQRRADGWRPRHPAPSGHGAVARARNCALSSGGCGIWPCSRCWWCCRSLLGHRAVGGRARAAAGAGRTRRSWTSSPGTGCSCRSSR